MSDSFESIHLLPADGNLSSRASYPEPPSPHPQFWSWMGVKAALQRFHIRLFLYYSFCSSGGCVLYPDVWSGSRSGRESTQPLSAFLFPERRRRRPPRMTPANTVCLPADSCALPNYQIPKSAVTHPHFSSRFILRGKGWEKLAAD